MSYSKKEPVEIGKGQPVIVMEKDKQMGLTPKQKKFMAETMHRHDKALKKLAQM